jgi:putative Mg2+ transporter-C (MgtC) family protein
MDIELHVVGRLVAAALLGALVGLEREASNQPAGLRTHLTVALGAALFGVISTVGFEEFQTTQRATNIQFDVTRVASTTVTAIGFLGAGLIFRRGTTIHNLTTAASLWVVAAVGLACGVGDIGIAFTTSVALLVALVLLRAPRNWIRRFFAHDAQPVRILLHTGLSDDGVTAALRGIAGIEVRRLGLEKEDDALVIVAELRADPKVDLHEQLTVIAHREDVRTLVVGVGDVGVE